METSTESSSGRQSTALRAVYTALIFLGQFALALVFSFAAASMVDLRYLMGDVSAKASISTASIALQSTIQIAGAAIGGLLSFTYKMSFLTPYLNRQLFTSIFIILGGVSFAVTPHLTSPYLFYGLSLLTGIGLGNMSTISNTWLIEMWSGRLVAVILQAVQLCFGLGYIVGPLLIKSHLHGHLNASKVEEMTVPEYTAEIDARRHDLIGPYIIVGSIVCLVGSLYLVLYLSVIFRYRSSSSGVKSSETASKLKLFESPWNRHRYLLFLVLILVIFATDNVIAVGFNSFQETLYQSLPSVKVTASEAAGVVSLGSTGYTAGRIVSILLSTVLSPGNLLLFHFGLSVSGFLGLYWSTQESLTAIRLNSILIGYSRSAIMPAMYAFVNTYSAVDDRRNAIFHLAMALPSIFGHLLIGQLIEKTPSILIYLVMPSPLISAIVFCFIRFGLVRKTLAKEEKERHY